MEMLRRTFLSSGLVGALAWASYPANAILFSGGALGGGGSAIIRTMSMNNTSGSSETPMWSPFMGIDFTDSDTTGCPLSGGMATYPVFKVGSTVIPYSMSNPAYHPSGRLRHAMFFLVYGTALTVANNATGSVTVNQSSNTSLPSASSRSLSDFSGANLQILMTELDGPSPGNYVANLLTGITDNLSYNYVWADGPAGKVWAIASQAKNGSTPEGNLWCIWYVASMQDAAGNFGGIRFLGSVTIPIADAASTTLAFRSFSALTLQNGATVLRDLTTTTNRPQTATCQWSGSGLPQNLDIANNYIETNLAFRVSMVGGIGTLPGGISASQTYFCYQGNYFTPPYSNIQVNTATGGNSYITMTSPASGGTMQITLLPALWPFGRIHTADQSGRWDYIQAGGSVVGLSGLKDTNLQVKRDMSYSMKTLTIPPYDLAATVNSGSQTPFYINGNCGLTTFPGAGGIDGHIGMLPVPEICHIYNQLLTDEYNVRAIGLAGGQSNGCVRPASNGYRLVSWNNGTNGGGTQYSQMGTLQWTNNMGGSFGTTTVYRCNQTSDYFNGIGQSVGEATHQTQYAFYAYWLTGEPQFCDIMMEFANGAIGGPYCGSGPTNTRISTIRYQPTGDATLDGSAQGSRNVVSNSVTYYGPGGQALTQAARQDAWYNRNIAFAWSVMPKSHPQCAAYWTYFGDVLRDIFAWVVSVIAQAPTTYASTNGLFNPGQDYIMQVWMASYWLEAVSHYYGMSADSNAIATMNKIITWHQHVYNTFGANAISCEEWLVRQSENPTGGGSAGGGPIIANDANFGTYLDGAVTNWSSGTANFTYTAGDNAYVPFLNDTWFFTAPSVNSNQQTPIPGAFTAFTPYYVVFVSGSGPYTIQLSATKGGSAITNSDNITNTIDIFVQAATPFATLDANGPTDYPSVTYRSILYAKSRGATTDPTTLASMASVTPTNSSYSNAPNFCFAGSV